MIITTHKQFPNYKRYEIEYEGRPLVMKNFFKRFLVLLVVFILGVAGTAFLMNNETTDDRSDMNDAVLPEVMVQFGDVLTNRMYGYRQPMEADFVRDSVTPLDTTKKLTLVVNP